MTHRLIMLVAGLLAAGGGARAETSISESTFGFGFGHSVVHRAARDQFEGETAFTLEGPTVAMGLTGYHSDRLVARSYVTALIDVRDSAILRYGASAVFGYNLLGGPLARVQKADVGVLTSSFPYCLTLVAAPSVNVYAFPDTAGASAKPLHATVVETLAGLDYTHAFLDTSVGLSVVGSLRSFFVSGDKISIKSLETMLIWRLDL